MASQTGSYDFKAAKQAYIKASSAQDAIDNLEIGGRNLARRTANAYEKTVTGNYGNGTWYDMQNAGGYFYTSDDIPPIESGQEYVLSFDFETTGMPSDAGCGIGARNDGATGYDHDLWTSIASFATYGGSVEGGHFVYHLSPKTITSTKYFAFRPVRYGATSVSPSPTIKIWNFKLEKGNTPTDWTPAPEDLVEQARLQTPITAAAAMTEGKIVCGTDSGYRDVAAGVSFDLGHSLLYCGKTIASGASSEYNYLSYDGVNASATGTIESGAAKKTLYLKGSISNNSFVISASPFLTTVIPNAESEYYYIPLGVMYSTTNIYFNSTNRLYTYINGAFQAVDAAGQILALQSINRLNTMEPLVESHSAQLNVMQDSIMSNVEAHYTRADEFNTYVDSQQSSLEQLSNSITAQFNESRELISSVNGALETYKDDISKYIRFSAEGIEIGEEGNALTLKIDNDEIGFYKEGDQIAYWDGSTLYTGNAWITLERQFRIGNFAAVPRSDGSVSWLKVGE